MAITEKQRHDLFTRFEEVLGADEAATMMELLPPVGWADVATKQDLEHLRVTLTLDVEAKLERGLRHQFQAMLAANAAMVALAVALTQLLAN